MRRREAAEKAERAAQVAASRRPARRRQHSKAKVQQRDLLANDYVRSPCSCVTHSQGCVISAQTLQEESQQAPPRKWGERPAADAPYIAPGADDAALIAREEADLQDALQLSLALERSLQAEALARYSRPVCFFLGCHHLHLVSALHSDSLGLCRPRRPGRPPRISPL